MTISMPPDLARHVDRVARAEGRSRSELFREALRQYLERRERWDRIFAYGEARATELGVRDAEGLDAAEPGRRGRTR